MLYLQSLTTVSFPVSSQDFLLEKSLNTLFAGVCRSPFSFYDNTWHATYWPTDLRYAVDFWMCPAEIIIIGTELCWPQLIYIKNNDIDDWTLTHVWIEIRCPPTVSILAWWLVLNYVARNCNGNHAVCTASLPARPAAAP